MAKISKYKEDKGLVSLVLLLFLAIVWGLSFILVKKITVNFTAIELGAGRIFIAALSLLPWVYLNRKNFPKKEFPYLLLSGLLGYLIPAFIFGLVGSKLNSSLSGTLNATTPLFVLLVGAFVFGKKIENTQIIGILFGFIGSLILIFSGGKTSISFNNPYAFWVVLATILYGFNANIVSKYLLNLKPIVISSFSLLFVGIIALVVLLFTDFFQKIFLSENTQLLTYFIFLGAVNSAFAAVLYNYLLKIVSPVYASSVTYLIPVVATIAGIYDGETIGIWHYVGMITILFAIYILNKKSKS